MHAWMRLALAALVMAAVGCGVLVDDGYVPDPPDARPGSASDGGGDGDVDGGDAGPEAWWEAIEHDPAECPEEAARRRGTVCDPRCDGVSHFDCRNGSSDPCCACLGLGGGGGGDGGDGGDGPGAPPGDDSPGGPAGGGVPPGGSGGGGGPPRPSPSPRASAMDGTLPGSGRG